MNAFLMVWKISISKLPLHFETHEPQHRPKPKMNIPILKMFVNPWAPNSPSIAFPCMLNSIALWCSSVVFSIYRLWHSSCNLWSMFGCSTRRTRYEKEMKKMKKKTNGFWNILKHLNINFKRSILPLFLSSLFKFHL